MTKIYLICSRECISDGRICKEAKEKVMYAYTNKRLADKCIKYMNKEWQNGFTRNADFAAEKIRFFYRKTMIIEKFDYGKLLH